MEFREQRYSVFYINRNPNRRPNRNLQKTKTPNRDRDLQTSKALIKRQAHGISLFTSAASNQRGCPEDSTWEV